MAGRSRGVQEVENNHLKAGFGLSEVSRRPRGLEAVFSASGSCSRSSKRPGGLEAGFGLLWELPRGLEAVFSAPGSCSRRPGRQLKTSLEAGFQGCLWASRRPSDPGGLSRWRGDQEVSSVSDESCQRSRGLKTGIETSRRLGVENSLDASVFAVFSLFALDVCATGFWTSQRSKMSLRGRKRPQDARGSKRASRPVFSPFSTFFS